MMRRAWLAVALALAACYPPTAEPEPDRIVLEALLPTPLLDANTAACTAQLIAADMAAASSRLERATSRPAGYYAGYSRYRYWWSEDYDASYDAAQAAARATDARAAALRAAARVSAHPESAADYAELALAHAAAFAAADQWKDHARRSAETTLREMSRSQPDLEALYQQEFERRYGNEGCPGARPAQQPAGGERTPGVPVLGQQLLPLLPSPLLDRARASCAADIVSQRAATQWRLAWARQVGEDSVAVPGAPGAPGQWADWRAARAFADLAALHAGLFALDAAPGENGARGGLESRLRRMARQDPGLEKAYQDAFAPAYSGPACVRR